VAVEEKVVAGRCMANPDDNYLGYEALQDVVSRKDTRLLEILRILGINRYLCSSQRYSGVRSQESGVRRQGYGYGYNVRLVWYVGE
jgi:hypothetical protein